MADFFFELGALKYVKRSGWWYCGVKDPESVAEHSFRTAGIAYFLAMEEGADPEHALALGLVHDWLETRLGDLNKVNARYLETHAADEKVVADQAKALGGGTAGKAYLKLAKEALACRTKEARWPRTPTFWSARSRPGNTDRRTMTSAPNGSREWRNA